MTGLSMRLSLALLLACLGILGGCGGGGGAPLVLNPPSGSGGGQVIAGPGPNVATLTVDQGPTQLAQPALNIPYVTVRLCVPGTTTCQDIPWIEVDTGSTGLRIVKSALQLTLPGVRDPTSTNPYVECAIFGDGFVWGPLAQADLQISGETATNLPVQIIDDKTNPTWPVPTDCSAKTTGVNEGSVAAFGANGIIGVGSFLQDCGAGCAPPNAPKGAYYQCTTPGTACAVTAVATNLQVANPVSFFAIDNNGVIIELPALGSSGAAATVTGALVFGIGTAANNALGRAVVLPLNPANGYFTTHFNGATFTSGYIDSGSNFSYFDDASIATCGTSPHKVYCPNSTLTLTASNVAYGGMPSASASFYVDNANSILNANPTFSAFDGIAAPASDNMTFDYGLPFFFGQNIYTAIENQQTPGGPGPYFAY